MEAHWITEQKGCHYRVLCSACNKDAIHKTKSNYCPECGAHMTETETRVNKSIAPIGAPKI